MDYKKYEVKIYNNGYKVWYLNKERHREDGPAIEHSNGTKEWYLNGKLHRKNGPAIEWYNGDKDWYLNGNKHREDGPAVEYNNGDKKWYLNGKQLTEKEFNITVFKQTFHNKIIKIDGKKYKLIEV